MNHQTKTLTSAAISSMKPNDKDLADVGENRGLRVTCANAGTKSLIHFNVYWHITLPLLFSKT